MHKKLFYLILLLCFFKLFHVAYKSVQFSPNILFNSFKRNVAEKSSLGFASNDVIPLRDFLFRLVSIVTPNTFPNVEEIPEGNF